ncbi:MAG: glycosyltransferase family 1 protein [bacterium]
MIIGIDASRAFGTARTGTENYSYHLITHMLRLTEARKHQFVLFVRAKTITPSELIRSGVQIVEIKLPYLWTQVGLAAATWQHKLDILWVPAHTLPILRNPRVRTVVTIHGLEYEWLPEYRNWFQRWYLPLSTQYAVGNADSLIAVSKFTQKQLVNRLNADIKRINVIHEGVDFGKSASRFMDTSSRQKVLNSWKLHDKGYILFVGTIQPRKNLAFLIEVYAQIDLQLRKQSKLVIAGSQGWMAEEVYLAPQIYGVSENVVFTGRVSEEELKALYQGALVYVQPSITEGFGLPVLEAMASLVPVVSSDGGALPEVVGNAGLVLPVCDNQNPNQKSVIVAKWVDGLTKVLSNPRLRERLIAAGKWRLREFGWDVAARSTLDYLVK